MAQETQQLAHFGSKLEGVPVANVFDFVTSNPFERERPYNPASQRVPAIEGSRPIFVDHKSGECSPPPNPTPRRSQAFSRSSLAPFWKTTRLTSPRPLPHPEPRQE